jgi:hypothetical protein
MNDESVQSKAENAPQKSSAHRSLAIAQSVIDFLKRNLDSNDPVRRVLVVFVVFLGAAGPMAALYALVQTHLVSLLIGILIVLFMLVVAAFVIELLPNISDARRRRAIRFLVPVVACWILLLPLLREGAFEWLYRETLFRYALLLLWTGEDLDIFVETAVPRRDDLSITEASALRARTVEPDHLLDDWGLERPTEPATEGLALARREPFLRRLVDRDKIVVGGDLDLSAAPGEGFIILAAKRVEIAKDSNLTLGGRSLVLIAHELALGDSVRIRQYRGSADGNGEEGDGVSGLPAGHVSIFLLGKVKPLGDDPVGQITVDVAGEDGRPGRRGTAGRDAPSDAPTPSTKVGVSVTIDTKDEGEKEKLLSRLNQLKDEERQRLFLRLRSDCLKKAGSKTSATQRPLGCSLRVCVEDAGPGTDGKDGNSGGPGEPGGSAGRSGRLFVYSFDSSSAGLEDHFLLGRSTAEPGKGGPGGIGGAPQPGGLGGPSDLAEWCLPGISGRRGQPGPQGEPGESGNAAAGGDRVFRTLSLSQ